jgi:hypothetical protein
MSDVSTPQVGDDQAADLDVVALLMRQHGDIRNLFDEVEQNAGQERRDAFRRLVRLAAGRQVVEDRLAADCGVPAQGLRRARADVSVGFEPPRPPDDRASAGGEPDSR